MKQIILFLFIFLFTIGCSSKTNNIEVKEPDNSVDNSVVDSVEVYTDLNSTPIGFYKLSGNRLTRLNNINVNASSEDDIGLFQIYPSNEDIVNLDKAFALSYHDEWIKYSNIKLGFNIKYYLTSGDVVSYNIFSPDNTFEKWEYLMNYLYDDYANYGRRFYSHVESNQVNEETLYTAFKMQAGGNINEINKILLSVFTFDSFDDFLNNEYRGNSLHTISICVNRSNC